MKQSMETFRCKPYQQPLLLSLRGLPVYEPSLQLLGRELSQSSTQPYMYKAPPIAWYHIQPLGEGLLEYYLYR